ncbi:putative lipoprotein LPRE [Mycobacterium tuberculosis RGTB423]|nr:putative lipoprotein LPRE [Mycobacterium tuberculosis RGTB423]
MNLASPTIAKVVSELPRDPRSEQPWNPEPLAGNYNECAQLSAVVIKANTNAGNPTTRAVNVPPRQVHTAGGARYLWVHRHRHLAVHGRHGGIDVCQRHRVEQRCQVPLERRRRRADRQHHRRLSRRVQPSLPVRCLTEELLLCSSPVTASSTVLRISQPPPGASTHCSVNSTRN